MRPLRRIIVHHTASPSTTTPGQIDEWHRAKGWSGIGYHFVFWQSLHGWRFDAARPLEQVGAHDAGENADSIGVAMCGDYSRTTPDPEAVQALATRVAQLCADHGIEAHDVRGHGEDGGDRTECPGAHFNMVRFRERVQERLVQVLAMRQAYRDLRPPEMREAFAP